ncbi:MAG TPA: PepSY domain-containing protein [Gammaproteobacteria bacterium]|nr:PepSY domain-containing protein [Gammaproteobacteria bacterium]
MSIRHALLALSTALLLAATSMQVAEARPPQSLQQAQAAPLSLNEAAKMVQQRVGGRVLAAEVAQSNGQTYYLIRILVRKGQVKVYRVDPHSGRMF